MPTCLSHVIFFRWPSHSQQSARPSSGKTNMPIGWRKSSIAREVVYAASKLFIGDWVGVASTLSRFGKWLPEEPLPACTLTQRIIPIEVRRQPALKSLSVEYGPMHRLFVAHPGERIGEPSLERGIEVGPRSEHAMVVRR